MKNQNATHVIERLKDHLRAIELRVDGFNQKFTSGVKAETRSMLDSIKAHCRDAAKATDGPASNPERSGT